jgi:UDP-sugar pyrophosphorylase
MFVMVIGVSRTLRMLGAEIAGPRHTCFNGLDVELWPRVVWSPRFAQTFEELASKLIAPNISLATDAALVVDGDDVVIKARHETLLA